MAVYTGQVNNATSRVLGYCVYRRCVKNVYAFPSNSTCLCVLLKRGPSLTLRGVLSNQIRHVNNLQFRFRASCLVHYYGSINNKKKKENAPNKWDMSTTALVKTRQWTSEIKSGYIRIKIDEVWILNYNLIAQK